MWSVKVKLMVAVVTLLAFAKSYSQPPDCAWPEDVPCPPGCYPAEMLGLEVDCYMADGFHCCLVVKARYACRNEPNCLGSTCSGIAKNTVFTSSPALFGSCVPGAFCLRCSSMRYCGGNRVETPVGPIVIYPPIFCGEDGGIIEIPIPGDDPRLIPLPLPNDLKEETL